jgi:hypothetical protein
MTGELENSGLRSIQLWEKEVSIGVVAVARLAILLCFILDIL